MTKHLLIIAHAPSENTHRLAKAALLGANMPDITGVKARLMSPFDVEPDTLREADAMLLGTTENIGYMAGATKDMFDRCYNDWLDQTRALPVGLYIRAGLDGTATTRALTSIFNAQKWRLVAEPLVLHGDWSDSFSGEVEALGGAMAAGLEAGIF